MSEGERGVLGDHFDKFPEKPLKIRRDEERS